MQIGGIALCIKSFILIFLLNLKIVYKILKITY